MTVDEYHYTHAATDDILTEIGRIMVESADLEGVIKVALWQTTGMPVEFGQALTEKSNLGQLVKLLGLAVPTKFPSQNDRLAFKPINDELKAVNQLRNYIAHGYWRHGIKPNAPVSVSHKSDKDEFVLYERTWRADELYRVAARIGRVMEELIGFLEARNVSPPPLPHRASKRYQVPPEPKWPERTRRLQKRPPPPSLS